MDIHDAKAGDPPRADAGHLHVEGVPDGFADETDGPHDRAGWSDDEVRRGRGVKVTVAALGAAAALAIAGGLLANGASAGAATASGSSSGASTSASTPSNGLGSCAPGGWRHGRKPPTAAGTVQSVDGNSFVISTRAGKTVTVDVTSSTTYRDRAVADPTLSNVTKGAHVAVIGSSSNGTVTATTVLIGQPPSGFRPRANGKAPIGPPPSGSTGGGAASGPAA